jgi:hypothetical protein
MESPMLKMVKSKNPDKEYPSNFGQKWTTEEENTLLHELDKNMIIKIIAQTHNRTIGGIIGKQRTIAYNMYVKNMPIEEIIKKTMLDKEQIMETITKKENPPKKIKITQEPTIEPKKVSLINEIIEMRSEIKELKNTIKELVEIKELKNTIKELVEIKELKNTIKELVEMIKAMYVFEDVA